MILLHILIKYLCKWLFISCIIAILSGSASAIFLIVLQWATDYREENITIIYFLPIAGISIGLVYHYFGKDLQGGNNTIINEIYSSKKAIPILMAPLVFLGTIATHLFGGSAGREGTAIQMSSSLSDSICPIFKLNIEDRKILLISSISAGFGSVFGTPLAGFLFGIELIFTGKIKYKSIFPALISAFLSDIVTSNIWGVGHRDYQLNYIKYLVPLDFVFLIISGIILGLVVILFVRSISIWNRILNYITNKTFLHPFIAGVIIVLWVILTQNTKYLGLGLPTISEAFNTALPPYDFILKLLFTAITLGAGYKGGEVTPLFFIGATLGNALCFFIPLPLYLLTAIGFVGVFAGATKTPLACSIMAMELFGWYIGIYTIIPCIISSLVSRKNRIYSSQIKPF